ncbi:DUF5777 family beta-barrel protein [uncultured Mucilaginibacter sp.]|uniref:DUF5777 family beta-barrel protein n=1 Tax=uncultured Mucilaginibacter sp. TaxID=797541 RepID=UPI0025DB311E|nr:DUF5777 family beta-barrel protein [uncultured Mucilaginibacter sp.]
MKNFFTLLAFLIVSTGLLAQKADSIKKSTSADSLFNAMNSDNKHEPVAIFESSRLILSQSTETIKKNNFNVLIMHRFGDVGGDDGSGKSLFGLDYVADLYIGFEYGLTNNLNIDIGRSAKPDEGGLISLEVKYALLHQTSDESSPFALTLIGTTGIRPYGDFDRFSDRVSYFAQAIIARKISRRLSLQVAPSFVQNNLPLPDTLGSKKGFFSVSAAARLKVTKLMSIIVDYAHPFSSFRNSSRFSDPLGFGIQLVTGGHVFTMNITNARTANEINYLSNTTADYLRGNYRIGFTIARLFDFNHRENYQPRR